MRAGVCAPHDEGLVASPLEVLRFNLKLEARTLPLCTSSSHRRRHVFHLKMMNLNTSCSGLLYSETRRPVQIMMTPRGCSPTQRPQWPAPHFRPRAVGSPRADSRGSGAAAPTLSRGSPRTRTPTRTEPRRAVTVGTSAQRQPEPPAGALPPSGQVVSASLWACGIWSNESGNQAAWPSFQGPTSSGHLRGAGTCEWHSHSLSLRLTGRLLS